jgi:hypothetical protein
VYLQWRERERERDVLQNYISDPFRKIPTSEPIKVKKKKKKKKKGTGLHKPLENYVEIYG